MTQFRKEKVKYRKSNQLSEICAHHVFQPLFFFKLKRFNYGLLMAFQTCNLKQSEQRTIKNNAH